MKGYVLVVPLQRDEMKDDIPVPLQRDEMKDDIPVPLQRDEMKDDIPFRHMLARCKPRLVSGMRLHGTRPLHHRGTHQAWTNN